MPEVKELILGGARSGKSAYAERCAQTSGFPVTCIVTATAGDAEMAERIDQHRRRRSPGWTVVEEPVALATALTRHAAPRACIIVDCLTLWLSNVLFPQAVPGRVPAGAGAFERERDALLECLPRLPGQVILVANEIGLGVVPLGAETRRFCDEAGRLNQELARLCGRVTFMAAGLPLELKRPGLA